MRGGGVASGPRNSGRGASPAVLCGLCTAQRTASTSLPRELCWLPPFQTPCQLPMRLVWGHC